MSCICAITLLFSYHDVVQIRTLHPKQLLTNVAVNRDYVTRHVRIAYFVQAYEQTLHLLPTLFDRIWDPENIYALHIDAKVSSDDYKKVERTLRRRFNNTTKILFLQRQFVTYFGITTVLNTIDAISALLKASFEWDYFINLSASDYPLVPPNVVRDALSAPAIVDNKLNFVQITGSQATTMNIFYDMRLHGVYIDTALWANMTVRYPAMNPLNRTSTTNPCINGCLWRLQNSSHPLLNSSTYGKIPFVKAEAWMILHRTFAEFAVNSPAARRLVTAMATIPCPEEMYFSTLLFMDAAFRKTAVPDAFRFLRWSTPSVPRNGSHPVLLDTVPMNEVVRQMEASGALFARKIKKKSSEFTIFVDQFLFGADDPEDANEKRLQRLRVKLYKDRVLERVSCTAKTRRVWRSPIKNACRRANKEQKSRWILSAVRLWTVAPIKSWTNRSIRYKIFYKFPSSEASPPSCQAIITW